MSGRRHGKKQKQNASGRTQQGQDAQQDSANAPETPVATDGNSLEAKRHACNSCQEKGNGQHAKNEGNLVRLTGALVGVGIATLFVLGFQALIFYWTDEAGRITNRAYVFLQDIVLTPITESGRVTWAVTPQWVNGGNTTTRDMEMRVAMWGADNAADHIDGFTRCDAGLDKTAVVLGPRQISLVPFATFDPSPFQAIQDGFSQPSGRPASRRPCAIRSWYSRLS